MIGRKNIIDTGDDLVQNTLLAANGQFIEPEPNYDTDLVKAISEQYKETDFTALRNMVNTTGNLTAADINLLNAKLQLLNYIVQETQYPSFMKGGQNIEQNVLNETITEINLSKNKNAGFLRSFTESVKKVFAGKIKQKSVLKGDE